jgi:DNA-binding transcriptional LysR family regulator
MRGASWTTLPPWSRPWPACPGSPGPAAHQCHAGFGRSHIAPLIASFVRRHPQIQVQLQLSASPPPLVDDSFDVCIRFGEPPDARVIARRLAPNGGCCARRRLPGAARRQPPRAS